MFEKYTLHLEQPLWFYVAAALIVLGFIVL